MKKFLFAISLLLLLPFAARAQMTEPIGRDVASKKTIGTYNLSVTYNFSYLRDTVRKSRRVDIERLDIGKEFSRYYSALAEQEDSALCGRLVETGGKSRSSFAFADTPQRYEDFFINYPKKGVLTCRTEIVNTDYEYTEPVSKFNWTFVDSTAEVLGYKCKMAVATFRGREWRVYYTEDVPTKYGPWKFYGLPGLILKAADSKNWFEWEAVGISQEPGNICIYDEKAGRTIGHDKIYYKTTARDKVRGLQKMIWDNPVQLGEMHGNHTYKYYDDEPDKALVRPEDYASFRESYIPPMELK